jgi:hypothetical protein
MNMNDAIERAVQNRTKTDGKNLYGLLGAYSLEFPRRPAEFAAPDAGITIDETVAGVGDDAIELGKRIAKRWNRVLFDLACGGDSVDPQAKKTITDALKLGSPDAIAASITGILISTFSVAPAVAVIVGVLLGRVLLPAATKEICVFWKEKL